MAINRKFGWHSGAVHCRSLTIGGGTSVSGETHVSDLAMSGALISGSGLVGQNIVLTTLGTAGSWACGLYVKTVEGTTKNVNGYLNAAEFELAVGGTYNPSDMCVLALNSTITNTAMVNCSHPAYVYLRDYGTATMNNLFWFADASIGAADSALLSTKNAAAVSHTIKILIGGTPYWIMVSDAR